MLCLGAFSILHRYPECGNSIHVYWMAFPFNLVHATIRWNASIKFCRDSKFSSSFSLKFKHFLQIYSLTSTSFAWRKVQYLFAVSLNWKWFHLSFDQARALETNTVFHSHRRKLNLSHALAAINNNYFSFSFYSQVSHGSCIKRIAGFVLHPVANAKSARIVVCDK